MAAPPRPSTRRLSSSLEGADAEAQRGGRRRRTVTQTRLVFDEEEDMVEQQPAVQLTEAQRRDFNRALQQYNRQKESGRDRQRRYRAKPAAPAPEASEADLQDFERAMDQYSERRERARQQSYRSRHRTDAPWRLPAGEPLPPSAAVHDVGPMDQVCPAQACSCMMCFMLPYSLR